MDVAPLVRATHGLLDCVTDLYEQGDFEVAADHAAAISRGMSTLAILIALEGLPAETLDESRNC